MAFEAHIHLAQSPMTGADYRVFHLIMPSIQDGNRVWVNKTALGKQLGMSASNVSRSIAKMEQIGVLLREETASGRFYSLNPSFAWYGPDNGAHTQAVKAWRSIHA